MRVVLTGPKAAGKTTIAGLTAAKLGWTLCETDAWVEMAFKEKTGRQATFRDIWKELGEPGFRELEKTAVEGICQYDKCVVGTGGSTLFDAEVRRRLCHDALVVLVKATIEVLWQRLQVDGIPAYLRDVANPKAVFAKRVSRAREVVLPIADLVIDTGEAPREAAAEQIAQAAQARWP